VLLVASGVKLGEVGHAVITVDAGLGVDDDAALLLAALATIRGNRSVQSTPVIVKRRTRPSLMWI
jgi:hypothetical protein